MTERVHPVKPPPPISASVEDYLTSIYRLQSTGERVGTTRLAELMGVSAPSVTVMLQRLVKQDLLVRNTSTGGVELTEEGLGKALALLRRQRLSERFLSDTLGLDWGQAFEEAHRFEHALSSEVTDALERFLGYPTTCPHGNPIPSKAGVADVRVFEDSPLSMLRLGDHAVVSRVDEHSAELLRWFQGHGLKPGAHLHVEQVDPSGSTMLLVVEGVRVAVGEWVTRYVRVVREEVTRG